MGLNKKVTKAQYFTYLGDKLPVKLLQWNLAEG